MATRVRCSVDLLSETARRRLDAGERLTIQDDELTFEPIKKTIKLHATLSVSADQLEALIRAMQPHVPNLLVDFGTALIAINSDQAISTVKGRFAQCNTKQSVTSEMVISYHTKAKAT